MTPSLVSVGRIGRTHGVRGEVSLNATSLSAAELEAVRTFTWRGPGGKVQALTLESARAAHGRVLACFEGIHDRERAAMLTRGELLVEAERLPDPGPGVAYEFQLIGLRVITEDGRELGRLEQIIATGAHPVYVVRGGRELLVPATPQVLRNVDLEGGTITVALPAGLEDLE